MNKLNQNPHKSQQTNKNNRLRFYKRQKGMVKRTPEEQLAFLGSASMPAKRMALAIFPLFCKHGFARITQATLGERLGYCSKTMGAAGDELHDGGFLWKINQEWKDGKPTCCEYEGMPSCFSVEVIEYLFTFARSIKELSFWMLYTFKGALQHGNFPLLSSSYIYISLSSYVYPSTKKRILYKNSIKEISTKKDPPKDIKSSKESLQKGKTMCVNNNQSLSTNNDKAIAENNDKEIYKMLCDKIPGLGSLNLIKRMS